MTSYSFPGAGDLLDSVHTRLLGPHRSWPHRDAWRTCAHLHRPPGPPGWRGHSLCMMGPVTVLLSVDAQYLFVNLTKKLASMPSQVCCLKYLPVPPTVLVQPASKWEDAKPEMCYLNGEMQKKKKKSWLPFFLHGRRSFFCKRTIFTWLSSFSLSINTEGPER